MNKLEKTQRILCILPLFSTAIICLISMRCLKKHRAGVKLWALLFGILFGAGILAVIITETLMSGQYPFLNFIVMWMSYTLANFGFIELQKRAEAAVTSSSESGAGEEAPRDAAAQAHKKYLIAVFAVAIVAFFIVVFAFVLPMVADYMNDFSRIEDLNGAEDTSLNTITHEDILAEEHTSSMLMVGYHTEGEASGVTGKYKKYDADTVRYSIGEFHGVAVAQATLSSSDRLRLMFESEVEEGNLAIVVTVDGEYYCDVVADGKEEVLLDGVADKLVLVKLAGESAKISVRVERAFE